MLNIKETRNFGKRSSSSSFLPSLPSTIPLSLSLPPFLPSFPLPLSLPSFLLSSLPSSFLSSLSQSISLFTLFLGLASVAVQTVLFAPIPAIGPAGKTTGIGNWTTMSLDVTEWLELLVNIITILSKFWNASCKGCNTIRTVSAADIQRELLTDNLWISCEITAIIIKITIKIIKVIKLTIIGLYYIQ